MIKIRNLKHIYIVIIVAAGIAMLLPSMQEINSYIFIFSFLLLPIILGVRLLVKRETTHSRWLTCFVISIILCYAFIVLSTSSIGSHYMYELKKYDLNCDGMFSGDEITPDMEEAMKRLTNDTGRTFVPIIADIVSPLYNGFWFVFFTFSTINRKHTGIKKIESRY